MRKLVNWIFYSKENLTLAFVTMITVMAVAFLVFVLIQIPKGGGAGSPVYPTATARPIHTELIPPTTEALPTITKSYGPSQPIALEAADAFLSHDLIRFGRVALPAAVEAVSDAPEPPAAARDVTGPVVVRQGGTTQQTDEIPTSGGMLQLVMVISGGRWQVSMIRYAPLT
jgi:hypothetical protein